MHKIKLTIIILLSLLYTTLIKSQDTILPNYPGLQLWLVADSVDKNIDNAVSQWTDISGNNNHILQPITASQPKLVTNTLNNRTVIQFDGTNDYLTGGDICDISIDGATFFIVGKSNASTGTYIAKSIAANQNGRWALYYSSGNFNYLFQNGSQHNINYPRVHGDFELMTATTNFTTLINDIDFNGIDWNEVDIVSSYDMNNSFDFLIGAYNNSSGTIPPYGLYLDGKIAEILIYNIPLSDSMKINIEHYLRAKYFPSDYIPSVNLGNDIHVFDGFTDTILNASDKYENYLWSTGETTQTISISDIGSYYVTVTDSYSHQSTDSIRLRYKLPKYPFVSSDTILCVGDTIYWDTELSSSFEHKWLGSQISSTTIPIYSEGSYAVRVVYEPGDTIYSDTLTIVIDSFPLQNSLGVDRDVCKYEAVTLVKQGENIQNWLWSTGSTNSFINIETANTYSVTVTNNLGCKGMDTANYSISGVAPTTLFKADTVCLGDSTTFTNLSDIEDGYVIDSILWEFGDGTISKLNNPKHQYATSDTFIISLTAYSGNCNTSYKDSIIILSLPSSGFIVRYGLTQCLESEIYFADTSISSFPITNYNWQFGDGLNSSLQNPSHSFSNVGLFDVKLIATNSLGCLDSNIQTITISDNLPLANEFTLNSPQNNQLEAIGEDSIMFQWTLSANAIYYQFEIAQDTQFTISYYTDTTYALEYYHVLVDTGIWYWRVKAFNLCGEYYASTINKLKIFSPNKFGDLTLWLKADKGIIKENDKIKGWLDNSVTKNNITQYDTIYSPNYVENFSNGYPGLKFDGSNDYLTTLDSVCENGNWTIIFILKTYTQNNILYYPLSFESGTNNKSSWSSGGTYFNNATGFTTGDNFLKGDKILNNSINYGVIKKNVDEYSIKLNNGKYYQMTDVEIPINRLFIGKRPDDFGYFNGEIAEIFIYNEPLDSIKIYELEYYLRNKYTPIINLGANIIIDYGFTDTTISAHQNWFNSYLWSTGSTDSAITISKNGNYTVSVTDIFGFTSTDSVKVDFLVKPKNLKDTTICLYDTITWNPALKGEYYYEWSNGETTPQLEITDAGDYWVIIKDTNDYFWESDTLTVVIDSFPLQNSLGVDRDVCKYETVTLVKQGENIQSWLWSTGSTNSFINIETANAYSVTVTNSIGCVGMDTAIYGISGVAPNVLFEADTVCLGDSTAFTNLCDIEDGYVIDSILWEFGDGTISKLNNPKHQYATSDTFIISLTAYSGNCNSFYNDSIIVLSLPSSGFVVRYGLTQCVESEIYFTDTSISSFPITDYNWQFGDGINSSLQNPSHSFSNVGLFDVKLIATNALGCLDSSIQTITISDNLPLSEEFSLISPQNNQLEGADSIMFQWNTSTNAIYYQFEIAQNTQFTISYYTDTTNALEYYHALVDTGIWYWRVKAFNLCGEYYVSTINKLKIFSPNKFGDLTLWLKADKGILKENNKVTSWLDNSAAENNITQYDTIYSPNYIVNFSNGYPSLNFDGTNDYLSTLDSVCKNGDWTMLFILKTNTQNNILYYPLGFESGTNNASAWSSGGTYFNNTTGFTTGDNFLKGDKILSNSINYGVIKKNVDEYSIKLNNGNYYQMTDVEIPINRLFIGKRPDDFGYFNGEIAEIFIYNESLDSIKIYELEYYLRNKYTPIINLGSDIIIDYGFATDTAINAYQPWFTSYQWSNNSTDSTITVNQSGTYSASVVDIFCFESTDSVKVDFLVKPKNLTDTTICLYDTITWNPALKGEYYYEWSNGETTPQLEINDAGNYWVVIKDNKDNPWYSDTITVIVDEFARIISLGNDTTLCSGNRVYLQNGYDETTNYLWSTGTTEDHIKLETAGTYSVIASNSLGCMAYDTATFEINGIAPVADFTFTNQCFGDNTQFTDGSSSPDGSIINSWIWDFGESSDNNQNTSHNFTEPTTYSVMLTIGNENSCNNNIRKDVQIYNTPVVQFGPNATCSHTTTELEDISTSIDGEINQWLWVMPDGAQLNTQNPKYIFETAGINEVQLIIATDLNCTDTLTKNIDIKQGPIVDFSYSATCDSLPIYFTNTTEGFLNSDFNYLWTFEPNKFDTQNNPTYTFSDTGSFIVTLEVNQTINNCNSTISKNIFVNENPSANFNSDLFCEKTNGRLTDASTSPQSTITNWQWKIDSIGTFTGEQIELIFNTAGIYKTLLMVVDENGCRDTISNNTIVYALPQPHFLTNVDKGPIPLVVQFDNQTTGAENYSWDFGDGNSSTEMYPTHTYVDSGIFNIQLSAISNMGCTDMAYGSVKAVVSRINIVVTEVTAEITNGFMQVSAVVQNRGTLDLEDVELFYKANYGQTTKEVLSEPFLSGQTIVHNFATQMQIKDNIELTHLCVTALPANKIDDVPEDNEKCIAFESAFKPMNPYPNPAKDELIVEYIIPFEANVKIQLFNQYGKLTHQLFKDNSEAGFNRHIFDISSLSRGVYIYRIEYEGVLKSYQIVVE